MIDIQIKDCLDNTINCGKMNEMNPVIRKLANYYLHSNVVIFYIIDQDDERGDKMVKTFRAKYCPNLNIYKDELVKIYFLQLEGRNHEFWKDRFITFVQEYEKEHS